MSYVPTYSEVEEEIVSVTLNLSNYVTRKEFKNVTKVDTSDFALKTNVAEIKKKVDDIDVDKIDLIDELQGKNHFEQNYLLFKSEYKYFNIVKDSTKNIDYTFYWQSDGLMNSKISAIGSKVKLKASPPPHQIWTAGAGAGFQRSLHHRYWSGHRYEVKIVSDKILIYPFLEWRLRVMVIENCGRVSPGLLTYLLTKVGDESSSRRGDLHTTAAKTPPKTGHESNMHATEDTMLEQFRQGRK